MLVAESILMQTVRDAIRSLDAFSDEECECELDDQLPAITGQHYVSVSTAGMVPGERHATNGLIFDLRMSVRVVLFRRIGNEPRDRRRNVFLKYSTSVNKQLDAIVAKIDDRNHALVKTAQAALAGTSAEGGQFAEPFKQWVPDNNFRMVTKDPYDAAQMPTQSGDMTVAISRGVTFRNARFMMEKS